MFLILAVLYFIHSVIELFGDKISHKQKTLLVVFCGLAISGIYTLKHAEFLLAGDPVRMGICKEDIYTVHCASHLKFYYSYKL